MTYPVLEVTRPSAITCSENGRLTTDRLASIGPLGRLERTAARAWNALAVATLAEGFEGATGLTWTAGGTYRTFEQQHDLFLARFEPIGATPLAGRTCRFYMGGWWALRPRMALAATPGSSNHGLGLAVDAATGPNASSSDGDAPRSIAHDADGAGGASSLLAWLLAPAPASYSGCNAVSLGWSWEVQSEPWHLRYFPGDHVPARVLHIEAWIGAHA